MKNLDKAIEIAKQHQEMDRFIQGKWLQDEKVEGEFRGCFYGCMTQSNKDPIESFCEEYEIPLWLGYYSERIFEGISSDLAKKFPLELLESLIKLKDEFDFDILKSKIAIKRLTRLNEIVEFKEVSDALDEVISYHYSVANGNLEGSAAWSAAESAESAAESARSAAWSARPAARSAARSAAWEKERTDLLELLQEGHK